MIGQTLSHYRVTSALGAGGMGEVYRATDTTLGRDVAIKVLPLEVAQDPERLARFEREAKLLASLNHPNIAAIYGLEHADGKPFLALELVEGEDLKERLARGAIPVDEALEIARQIAEALEEAHAKGIVHRDLKPANVKLTPDGKVKVLDFGLAKAWGGDLGTGGSSIDLSQSPTLARTGTLAGVILGTAAYMSPEQASGKAVDKRADIWSFGVVLFEMLAGQSLFSGETASEVMASVIKEEPSWDSLPASCPPAIARLLRRCLRKRPRERLQDIGDARLEIQDVLAGTAVEAAAPSGDIDAVRRSERRSRSRERWIWATALVAAAGLASLVAQRYFKEAPEPRPAAHVLLDTPEDLTFWNWSPLAVSPDGRHVAFLGTSPGGRQLWIRPLDSPDARPLPGTLGCNRRVLLVRRQRVHRVRRRGRASEARPGERHRAASLRSPPGWLQRRHVERRGEDRVLRRRNRRNRRAPVLGPGGRAGRRHPSRLSTSRGVRPATPGPSSCRTGAAFCSESPAGRKRMPACT